MCINFNLQYTLWSFGFSKCRFLLKQNRIFSKSEISKIKYENLNFRVNNKLVHFSGIAEKLSKSNSSSENCFYDDPLQVENKNCIFKIPWTLLETPPTVTIPNISRYHYQTPSFLCNLSDQLLQLYLATRVIEFQVRAYSQSPFHLPSILWQVRLWNYRRRGERLCGTTDGSYFKDSQWTN